MKYENVTIRTPSRIHIGLIDMNGSIGRKDGSIGLALKYEGVIIVAKKTTENTIQINGIEKINSKIYSSLIEKIKLILPQNKGVTLRIVASIKQHIGLGSGTQLLLAILESINKLYDLNYSIDSIMKISNRGGTSSIGCLAFKHGGFIIDCGHSNKLKKNFVPSSYCNLEPSKEMLRLKFPNWNIILATPPESGLYGEKEKSFFDMNCPVPIKEVREISHIVLMKLIPSIIEKNIDDFKDTITKIQNLGFKKRENNLLKVKNNHLFHIINSGVYNFGLSSFGPTIYSVCETNKQLIDIKKFLFEKLPENSTVIITKASNKGAKVEYGREK